MFRTSLVAVPALRGVDPAITSGPGRGVMAMFAVRLSSEWGEQLIPMVRAPIRLASPTAPRTYGVRPLAAIPQRTSAGAQPPALRARSANAGPALRGFVGPGRAGC